VSREGDEVSPPRRPIRFRRPGLIEQYVRNIQESEIERILREMMIFGTAEVRTTYEPPMEAMGLDAFLLARREDY
jgi:hypothetical protein